MQAKQDELQEKEATTFDYDKEMGEALSTIFGNLRGIQEMRRITPSSVDLRAVTVQSTSETHRIKFQQSPSELKEHEERKEQRTNETVTVKCKRRLPVLPQIRKQTR